MVCIKALYGSPTTTLTVGASVSSISPEPSTVCFSILSGSPSIIAVTISPSRWSSPDTVVLKVVSTIKASSILGSVTAAFISRGFSNCSTNLTGEPLMVRFTTTHTSSTVSSVRFGMTATDSYSSEPSTAPAAVAPVSWTCHA